MPGLYDYLGFKAGEYSGGNNKGLRRGALVVPLIITIFTLANKIRSYLP